MAHKRFFLYISAITIAALFNGLAHGAARELQSALTNWDIRFLSFTANLNQDNNGDDIVSEFEISKNQVFGVELFAADCITPIAGNSNTGGANDVITPNGTPTRTNKNDNHDVLRIAHTIKKSELPGSNVWDGTANKLEICQKTKLILKVNSDPANDIIVKEDRRKFVVNLDLTTDFVVNSTMKAQNKLTLMVSFNTTLEVIGFDQPTNDRALYHGADMFGKGFEATLDEIVPLLPALLEFHPPDPREISFESAAAIALPVPLPDWSTMPTSRRMAGPSPMGARRELQPSSSSTVKIEVTLVEPCDNETHCNDLMNTTTLYDDATGFLDQKIESGRFTKLLQEKVAEYPLTRRLVNQVAQKDATLADKEGGADTEEFDALASAVSLGIMSNNQHQFVQRKLSIADANATGATHDAPVVLMEINEGGVFKASVSTDVFSYVKACKCDGWETFTCDSDVLEVNGELNICISSVKAFEVETDFIESMIINQAGRDSLYVIKDSNVELTSLTSVQYATNQDRIAVSTFVPSNMFSFGSGNTITVTGVVHMKLAGGDRRKLQIGLASSDNFEEDSVFRVNVNLGDKKLPSQKIMESSDSGTVVANSLAIVFGMVFGSTFSMFW